jgi:hypothetical protein
MDPRAIRGMLCVINNPEVPPQAKRSRPTPSDIQPDIRLAATLAANRVPFDVAFALVLVRDNAQRGVLLILMPVLLKRARHHHFRFVAAMGAGTHLFECFFHHDPIPPYSGKSSARQVKPPEGRYRKNIGTCNILADEKQMRLCTKPKLGLAPFAIEIEIEIGIGIGIESNRGTKLN